MSNSCPLMLLLLLFAPTGCSEAPIETNPDAVAAEVSDGDVDGAEDVCPSWWLPYYHPWWDTLLIEIGAGVPVGIDAVVVTHPCGGEHFFGVRVDDFRSNSGMLVTGELASLLGLPDASIDKCTGQFVTMTEGDMVAIKLTDALGPGDIVEVIVVEPDGACGTAKATHHIRLSIEQSAVRTPLLLGEGTTATVPLDLPQGFEWTP